MGVEPRSCDHGGCKSGALTLLATRPINKFRLIVNVLDKAGFTTA